MRRLGLGVVGGIFLLAAAPAIAETPASVASDHGLWFVPAKDEWISRIESRYSRFDKVFDEHGTSRRFASEYDQLSLDSSVIGALAPLGPGASLGTTSLRSKVEMLREEIQLGYGLTDDITLNVIIPFGNSVNHVDFKTSGGNVGWNVAFDPSQPIGPTNFPFAPVGFGATQPLTTADVQAIISDPLFGYAYKPVRDRTKTGLMDPVISVTRRFQNPALGSAIAGIGYRYGVEKEDPDYLFDVPRGNDDVIASFEYFRDLGRAFDIRGSLKHTIQLPDEVTKRVYNSENPLVGYSKKERVRRDLGDYWDYELEFGYHWTDWRVSGIWHRYEKESERYTAPSGADTTWLEHQTSKSGDQLRLSLSWKDSTRGFAQTPPFAARFDVQETYAGRNMLGWREYYLVLTARF